MPQKTLRKNNNLKQKRKTKKNNKLKKKNFKKTEKTKSKKTVYFCFPCPRDRYRNDDYAPIDLKLLTQCVAKGARESKRKWGANLELLMATRMEFFRFFFKYTCIYIFFVVFFVLSFTRLGWSFRMCVFFVFFQNKTLGCSIFLSLFICFASFCLVLFLFSHDCFVTFVLCFLNSCFL